VRRLSVYSTYVTSFLRLSQTRTPSGLRVQYLCRYLTLSDGE